MFREDAKSKGSLRLWLASTRCVAEYDQIGDTGKGMTGKLPLSSDSLHAHIQKRIIKTLGMHFLGTCTKQILLRHAKSRSKKSSLSQALYRIAIRTMILTGERGDVRAMLL